MTHGHVLALYALAVAALPAAAAAQFDPGAFDIVDLTHPLDAQTIYWPADPPERFHLTRQAFGETDGGFFYASNSFCTAEHGGTHLDAPLHFAREGNAVDRVPLERLVAPAVVIDVTEAAGRDRDHRLSVEDVRAFEEAHGTIAAGSIVLLRTGWSRYWPDVKAYLGDDRPGDASALRFPSFGVEAARFLVEERNVATIGVDTASIDYGRSHDFAVHRLVAARNVAGLENLTNLEKLPATGALVVALPVKIGGGSGGPVRAIALVPRAPAAPR
jgi:kynurenine formamidase